MKIIKQWFNKMKIFVMNILKVALGMAKKAKELTKDVVEGVKEGLQSSDIKQVINDNEYKKVAIEFGKDIIDDKNKRKVIGNIIIALGGGVILIGCSLAVFGIGIRFS